MQIHEYMHTKIIAAHPDMSILDAQKVMHENHIHRLPVVHTGKLAGLLTEGKLRQSLAPYTAYSISAWEFNWMLSRTKVKDVMQTELITFNPYIPVEDALASAQQHRIGTILVVDNSILVGICTTTEMSNLLIKSMGLCKPGACLHISGGINDARAVKAIDIVRSYKVPINSFFTITAPRTGKEVIVIHLNAVDIKAIVNELKTQEYEVKSFVEEPDQSSISEPNLPRHRQVTQSNKRMGEK